MDFRSNEAGRAALLGIDRRLFAEPISGRPVPLAQIAAGASSQSMNIETRPADFTDEQKRYLEGFATGLQISKAGRGVGGATPGKTKPQPNGPGAAHIKGQGKFNPSRKETADQEKIKNQQQPF